MQERKWLGWTDRMTRQKVRRLMRRLMEQLPGGASTQPLSQPLDGSNPFWDHWWPGLSGIFLTLLLWQSGIAGATENFCQQLLFRIQSAQHWDERIVLVKIDQPSLDALGWFPWSRDRYRELLETLSLSDSNTVIFSLIFSEHTPEDPALASAMVDHGQVILANAWHPNGQPWLPTPPLYEAAIATGHIEKRSSNPFQTTATRTTVSPQIQTYPALALAVLQVQQLREPTLQLPEQNAPLIPNWPAPIEQLEQYSFADVVAQQVPPEAFQDKLILVGATAPGLDPLALPYKHLGQTSGVHLHAALLHSLLQQTTLRPLPQAIWPPLLLAWLLIYRYGLARFPLSQRGSFLALGAVGWVMTGAIAFQANRLVPIAMPLVLMGSTGIASLISHNRTLSQRNQRLEHQALVDETTQIRNRLFFNEYSSFVWQQMVRDARPLALILCDVDHFKAYNDTYGHPAGDRCLYQIAQAIQTSVHRASELVARYGGEEFVILLPATDLTGAICVAQHIQTELSAQNIAHIASSTSDRITLSLGIACVQPTVERTLGQLIEQADQALYQAKREGRARYCIA